MVNISWSFNIVTLFIALRTLYQVSVSVIRMNKTSITYLGAYMLTEYAQQAAIVVQGKLYWYPEIRINRDILCISPKIYSTN